MHVDVPEHGAVHQSSEEEVDVAHQHQRQAHLHQGFVVLEVGAAYSWRKYEDGLGTSEFNVSSTVQNAAQKLLNAM